MPRVTRSEARRLVGRRIYAVRKDGSVVVGKLLAVKGDVLHVQDASGNKLRTQAFIPLVLFDLLAIGTAPFAFGFGHPFGFGFGGFDPFW